MPGHTTSLTTTDYSVTSHSAPVSREHGELITIMKSLLDVNSLLFNLKNEMGTALGREAGRVVTSSSIRQQCLREKTGHCYSKHNALSHLGSRKQR